MTNAKYLMANRSTLSASPYEKEMTANELLEIMCANSPDSKVSLYNEKVTSVPGVAFQLSVNSSADGGNYWLESIELPNCTSVGYRSFYRCLGLKRIMLPSLASCNAASSFQQLSALEEIDIGDVTSPLAISFSGVNPSGFTLRIGNASYSGTSSVALLSIPTTVTGTVNVVFRGVSVGVAAARGIKVPLTVDIRDSVTSIGNNAFRSCTGLSSVTIPSSVTRIGTYAFQDCTGLTSVTIPESVLAIGSYCFGGCSFRIECYAKKHGQDTSYVGDLFGSCEVHFHNDIEYYGFSGIKSSFSAVIEDSVSSLSPYAFADCEGLVSLSIGSGITSLPEYCFDKTYALTSVVIPDQVTSLGELCFGNSGLVTVVLGRSVSHLASRSLACSSLASITSLNTVPPGAVRATADHSFYGVDRSIPVYVPAESVDAYKEAAGWNEFTNIQAIQE